MNVTVTNSDGLVTILETSSKTSLYLRGENEAALAAEVQATMHAGFVKEDVYLNFPDGRVLKVFYEKAPKIEGAEWL